MVKWRHESLRPRFAATSAASHRPGQEPGRGGSNLCHFSLHHQTVCQRPPRERPCLAQSHSWSPQPQRGSLTGWVARAVESASRRHARATLPDVGSHSRPQGQFCQHHACPAGLGLDAKKKTRRASEQKEAERAAWRTQAADLPSQDLIFLDETASPIAMTPLYA